MAAAPKRRPWSEGDLGLLKELYPAKPTAEVAAILGRPVSSVYNAAFSFGLKKTPEALAAIWRARPVAPGSVRCRFPKGHVPANKGVRSPGWAPGRMAETQFKKGERSGIAAKNWRPIGTILPDTEGYLRIKVREAEHGKEAFGFGNTKVWPLYSRYVWEQHKGPIPPKHIVAFKDRDRSNCAIENLELLSMADNARRNSMWRRMPPELIAAIQLNGVLKRRIRSLDGQEPNK